MIVAFLGLTHLLFYIETALYIGNTKCSDSCEPAQSGCHMCLFRFHLTVNYVCQIRVKQLSVSLI